MRFFFLGILAFICAATPALARQTITVGWVENILLAEVGTVVKAKLDTGAKTSSIDSEIIDIRKTGHFIHHVTTGETVVFSIKNSGGVTKTFEREIKRYVRIKLKGGGYVRRPVIKMAFCLGGRRIEEEVNLANRENFIYPVLIGRNMMAHAGLVINPAATFLSQPVCNSD